MKLKLIPVLFAFSTLNACSEYFPIAPEQPIQLTDEQRLEKAKYDFDQQDYVESQKNLSMLAEKNNKEALYALGYQYYYGLGVEKNNKIAQEYIRRSADQGYKPAIRALRQFIIANSTFVVDTTKSPDHLSTASTDKDDTQISSNKILDPDNNDSNTAIDELLEKTQTASNIQKQPEPQTSLAQNNTSTTPHGFGYDDSKSDATNNLASNTPSEPAPNKITNTSKPTITKANNNTKLAAQSKPKAKLKANLKANLNPSIWDSSVKISADDAKVIAKINKAEQNNHNNAQLKNESIEQDKISIVNIKNNFSDNNSNTDNNNDPYDSTPEPLSETSSPMPPTALKNTTWLQEQKPTDYTIQVTASNNLDEIDKFIKNNNLQNKVKSFSYLYNNQTWYGAGYGVYNKPSEAYQALLEELPADIKLKKPWVRQFKNIVPTQSG